LKISSYDNDSKRVFFRERDFCATKEGFDIGPSSTFLAAARLLSFVPRVALNTRGHGLLQELPDIEKQAFALTDIELSEISLVDDPACPGAKIALVKRDRPHGAIRCKNATPEQKARAEIARLEKPIKELTNGSTIEATSERRTGTSAAGTEGLERHAEAGGGPGGGNRYPERDLRRLLGQSGADGARMAKGGTRAHQGSAGTPHGLPGNHTSGGGMKVSFVKQAVEAAKMNQVEAYSQAEWYQALEKHVAEHQRDDENFYMTFDRLTLKGHGALLMKMHLWARRYARSGELPPIPSAPQHGTSGIAKGRSDLQKRHDTARAAIDDFVADAIHKGDTRTAEQIESAMWETGARGRHLIMRERQTLAALRRGPIGA
jgi:hypothetical protein